MNKKFLIAILLCFTIIFPSCTKEEAPPEITSLQEITKEQHPINTKIEVNGYPDETEFIKGFPYNDNNPFGKYYQTVRFIKENENAVKTRYIDIGDKTLEFNYSRSETSYYNTFDIYTLKGNEAIEVYYHINTDIVYEFLSYEETLAEIFPFGENTMSSEEALMFYSESIAKLLGFDLTGLEYTPRTSGNDENGEYFYVDEYLENEYKKTINRRLCCWNKVYSNGEALTAFSVQFSYTYGEFRVCSVVFHPVPDELFTISAQEVMNIAFQGNTNNIRVTGIYYTIVANNKLCKSVSYEYDVTYDNGDVATHVSSTYVFPADTVFP